MPPIPSTPRTKPLALQPGDTIGIVAPASNIKRDMLAAGCLALQQLGYKTVYFDSILEQELYFAGSVERRTRELEEMFLRDDIRAIVCARGGYGANYLLRQIDLRKIKSHPKIFVGYSDVTTLLTYFADAGGLVTFHGPMVAKDFAHDGGVDFASWTSALTGAPEWQIDLPPDSGVEVLLAGSAEGIFYGGCLSMLAASLGTPYEVQTAGTILFLEDVATKPYQIDRMLMQLKLAGKFDEVRAIIFGEMLDCAQNSGQGYTLQEVVMRVAGNLGVPIAYGLRSGHVSQANITLPIGVWASLNVSSEQVNLKILEPATVAVAARSRASK
jgi:muramoyltetrapeptide carboxypeptidase